MAVLSVTERVRTTHASRSADELLRAPVAVLLGVSPAAAAALAKIDVQTVFDLAASRVFAAASRLLSLARADAQVPLSAVPGDVVAVPDGVPPQKLAEQPLSILRPIGATHVAEIASALEAQTVRDLALWPPYLSAREVLAEAFFPEQQAGYDIDAPADLLPQMRTHPTERVFYKRLLVDASAPAGNLTPIEDADAIDALPALLNPAGFQRLTTGALLTFSQSWFAQGLTLGQLLHSTALAPGESTRIAMIDWSRRSRAATTESIDEAEDLTNTATHARALSEVTNATATELQSGSSTSSSTSSTGQSGAAFGLEIGPLAFGGSGGSSSTTTEAMSASSSFGTRDVAASFAQNINDRSQQHATAARTRRASIVREVSQEEHETITTRVVANYNHMHALTVNYYEVVQAFRVTTQLERTERCLFVPLQLMNFRDVATVERWRFALARAALTRDVARRLAEFGSVLITSKRPSRLLADALVKPAAAAAMASTTASAAAGNNSPAAETTAPAGAVAEAPAAKAAMIAALSPMQRMASAGWNVAQIERLRSLTGRLLLPRQTNSLYVSDDALVTGFTLNDGDAAAFRVERQDGSAVGLKPPAGGSVNFNAPLPIRELASIAIKNAQSASVTTTLTLHLNLFGTVTPLDVPIFLPRGGALSALHEVLRCDGGRGMRDLLDHLEANKLHYSQAIFRSLDGAAIATLLAGFTFRKLPLGQLVDHQPVAVSANCLVFKMTLPETGAAADPRLADDLEAWRKFLKRAGLEKAEPKTRVIPLPSGGVFAEAVLGRFNCAEHIDLERFFDWQDSPIPISAPEIAAIKSGSRAQAEDLTPGQLSQPIVNIQAPSALPDPTGSAAVLAALQNANMFRDMGGLAQTAALAQATQGISAAGATAAMQQAGQNLFTVMDQKTQRLRIAAQLAAQMMGIPVSGDTGSKGGNGRGSNTEKGGELAAAKELDAKSASPDEAGAASVERATFQEQMRSKGRELAEKVITASGLASDEAAEEVTGSAQPQRGVTAKQAPPDSFEVVLQLSSRFADTAVFGATPVKLEASVQEIDGRRVWEHKGAPAQSFSGTVRSSDKRLWLELFYEYRLVWPQPMKVVTNENLQFTVPEAATRVDFVAWVFVDNRTITLSDSTPPADDQALAAAVAAQGIKLNKVLSKPTVTPRAGGGFDVELRLLRVVLEQLSRPS
jgi:hypothetical protein